MGLLRVGCVRWLAPGLLACVLSACAGSGATKEPIRYPGEFEVYLQPYDERGICSVTVGLRNISQARQGEAWLELDWYDADNEAVTASRVRMDPMRIGRYRAKNLSLPLPCRQVGRLVVGDAQWELFRGWDAVDKVRVTIDGVADTEWRLRWNAEWGVFVGQRTP